MKIAVERGDCEQAVRRDGKCRDSREQARGVVERASRSPIEGSRKVIVLDEFHLVLDGAPVLLKTLEDPSPSTIFLVLADELPPELVTIASRCIRIDFQPISDDVVIAALLSCGVDASTAAEAAAAAKGDLTRARLLADDTHLAARREMFATTPRRLDGTGSAVVAAVDSLLAEIEAAAAPLAQRHAAEVSAMEERIASIGERGSGKKALDERHKRELRRHRDGQYPL